LGLEGIARKAGNAVLVFPVGRLDASAFIRFLLHAKGLPEQVLLVRPHVAFVPHLPVTQRTELTALGDGMQLVDIRYGFDDEPDVPKALGELARLELDPSKTRYYVVDDRAAAASVKGLSRWRTWLFAVMSAACMPAAEYFHLPPDATTEIEAHPRRAGP
jgi:KUP system potassium uptake protein